MTINVPDRRLLTRVPQAPASDKGLLRWARDIVAMLTLQSELTEYNTYTPIYAGTLEFSGSIAPIWVINTNSAIGNCTLNALAGRVGPSWIIINNDATAGRTITFGTGFSATGNLVGTVSKTAVMGFLSDGQKLYEVSRITGLTT